LKIHVAGISHIGNVRTSNEDYFSIGAKVGQKTPLQIVVDTNSPEFVSKGLLVAVADGMGGYAGGDLASRVMLESLTNAFTTTPLPRPNRMNAGDFVRVCLQTACDRVSNRLSKKADLSQGGTTIAGLALFAPDIAVVFHAGDSRVLRVSGRFIRPLTVDHTPIGPMAAAGTITEDESVIAPEMKALERSIGAEGSNDPEVNHEQFWSPGDRFIICSDGLHGTGRGLTAHDLRTAAQEELDTIALAQRLVTEALGKGGKDNITVVVLQVE